MKRKKNQPPEPFVAAIIPTECHIVTRDAQPCTLINVSGVHKGGVLIPGSPVIVFTKPRDARRAVDRTVAARDKLRTSLVSDWLRTQIPSFLDGARFEVVPAGHQSEPKPELALSKPRRVKQ